MDRIANMKLTCVELKQKLKVLTGKTAYGNKNELAKQLAVATVAASADIENTIPPSPSSTIDSSLSLPIRPPNKLSTTKRKRDTYEVNY